jgi:hypothetical protein
MAFAAVAGLAAGLVYWLWLPARVLRAKRRYRGQGGPRAANRTEIGASR